MSSEDMRKSLSDKDIKELCYPAKVKVVEYKELANKGNIDELLDRYDALILLYTTGKDFGHWVTIFPVSNSKIEFFDPYGIKMDGELKFVPEDRKIIDHEDYPHLTRLLVNSRYKDIVYNTTKLQKLKKGINTCGRWACVRVKFRKVPLNIFLKSFKGWSFSPDQMVVGLSEMM